MELDIEARLQRIEEKVAQNHELLVRIRKVQRNGQLFKLLYWLFIGLSLIGALYFIKPLFSQLLGTYGIGSNPTMTGFGDMQNINSLIDAYSGKEE